MLFRSGAAICGAVLALAISVTVARSEIGAVHSSAVVDAASGDAIVAQHPRTIRSGLDGGRAARTQPPASAMIPLFGRLPSRRACARNLAGSDMARGRSMPSLKL